MVAEKEGTVAGEGVVAPVGGGTVVGETSNTKEVLVSDMESEEKELGEVGGEGGWKQLCSIMVD